MLFDPDLDFRDCLLFALEDLFRSSFPRDPALFAALIAAYHAAESPASWQRMSHIVYSYMIGAELDADECEAFYRQLLEVFFAFDVAGTPFDGLLIGALQPRQRPVFDADCDAILAKLAECTEAAGESEVLFCAFCSLLTPFADLYANELVNDGRFHHVVSFLVRFLIDGDHASFGLAPFFELAEKLFARFQIQETEMGRDVLAIALKTIPRCFEPLTFEAIALTFAPYVQCLPEDALDAFTHTSISSSPFAPDSPYLAFMEQVLALQLQRGVPATELDRVRESILIVGDQCH
jgi:hypothetical protein